MKQRRWAWLWAAVVCSSVLYSAQRALRGPVVDASLLTLLPAAESDALLNQANSLLSQRVSRFMIFLAQHPDADIRAAMQQRLKEELSASPLVHSVLTDVTPEQQKAFYDLYFPLRYSMLSSADRAQLQTLKPLDFFLARLEGALYSPASAFLKNLIPQDPLLFFPELLRSWADLNPHDEASYTVVELAQDPFDSHAQDQMLAWMADVRARFHILWPDERIHSSGVLPFAAAERQRTEREMKLVSAAALVGVLALAWFVFRSLQVLLLAALPIAVGFAMASAAVILVFGKIHMITLAFGSSLIGVAIDYPLLFLAHRRMAGEAWNASETLKRIAPGLLLGAATALLGCSALSLAPFPGLRQMALFSSVGLAAALITVLLVFPHLAAKPAADAPPPKLLTWGRRVLFFMRQRWDTKPSRAVLLSTAGVCLLLTFWGLARVRFNDDIRLLQKPPKTLIKEDAIVREAAKGVGENRFILVRAADLEGLLVRLEDVQERLSGLLRSGAISSIQSLAPFLPSRLRQANDQRVLQQGLLPQADQILKRFKALGLAQEVGVRLLQNIRQPPASFSVEDWLKSPASQSLRALWIGSTPHGMAAAVLVGGLRDANLLQGALSGAPGVRFFDQTAEYSNLFQRYRRYSAVLIFSAYIAVCLLMMRRYGLKKGILVTVPSAAALVLTFSLLGWRGQPLHLIHCLSALLVLAMGIDYTIYFMESSRSGGASGPTLLAVELCAFTTLISFGLLALCQTPVLSAIGSVVFFGMALAFLFSPIPSIILVEDA